MKWLPLEGVDHIGRLTRESPPGIYVWVFDDGSEGGRYHHSYDALVRVRPDNSYVNTVLDWRSGIRSTLGKYRRIES